MMETWTMRMRIALALILALSSVAITPTHAATGRTPERVVVVSPADCEPIGPSHAVRLGCPASSCDSALFVNLNSTVGPTFPMTCRRSV
jgi:hypothetical protein